MADLNTKQKILNAAIQLFNDHGMANVRLQQIANEVSISPGNLAYHFKNKEAIVEALHVALHDGATEILAAYRVYPNLIDFDYQLTKYFNFIQSYPFYFLDLLEIDRQYPDLQSKRKTQIAKMITQIRARFSYNEEKGIILPQAREGVYDSIANAIWVLITFWVPQNLVRGSHHVRNIQQFKKMVWNQIYPYFSKKGKVEFEQLIVPILGQHTSDN